MVENSVIPQSVLLKIDRAFLVISFSRTVYIGDCGGIRSFVRQSKLKKKNTILNMFTVFCCK